MEKVGELGQLKSCYKKHANPNKVSPCSHKVAKDTDKKKKKKKKHSMAKGDWEGARCFICMEPPHNAVLLLCSSYNNGCRPYMCATSSRFSNCLDQYKKASTKLTSHHIHQLYTDVVEPQENCEVPQLCCPICRGQVKGWAVVEKARRSLNKEKRSCMHENCLFVGNYKQIKTHVKAEHPLSRPRDIDPALEEKWKTLESEREHNDVISAITSSDPSAIVLGDFVIEGNSNPFYRNFDGLLDDNSSSINPFDRFGFVSDRRFARLRSIYENGDDIGGRHRTSIGDLNGDDVPVSRHHRRLLFGRISRRTRSRGS